MCPCPNLAHQFREANEEVALPLHSPHVHTICTLDPFISQFKVVVTPVVALVDDVSILDTLRAAPGEVAQIFDHPLEALLDPELARGEKLVPIGSEDWPYEAELYVSRRHFYAPCACIYKNYFFSVSFVGGSTELHGQRLDGHDVPHASFSEHCLSSQGTDGRYSSATPSFVSHFAGS